MPYKQLSISADGQPLGEYTIPLTSTGQTLITDARTFALNTGRPVHVWERIHGHPLAYPRPCLDCPPGKLIRSWNNPRPDIMRSLAYTALLDLDPSFGKTTMAEGSARITDVLTDFYESGELNLYDFVKGQMQS